MLELAMSVELGSPAETVWNVVGNFNGLPDWHPWVKASVLDPLPGGVGRRVTIEGAVGGRRELHERLVSHDYSRRNTHTSSWPDQHLAAITSVSRGFCPRVWKGGWSSSTGSTRPPPAYRTPRRRNASGRFTAPRSTTYRLCLASDNEPTSATATAWERTPWHATQRAAWEALRRADS